MPLRHSPMSLQKCSIVALAENWDWICYACRSSDQMGLLLETEGYLDTEGPFVDMPSSLLENLMEVIGERRSLTRKFLHLLIREQLETLNLSFGTGEVHYGFQFLRRCRKLHDLNLSYLRHIEPNQLLSIIPYLKNIVCLNLQMTCAIDQILGAIGDTCPHLRDLNLTSTLISDDGIFRLSGEKQNDGIKRCQQLQRLIVTETRISWVGALSVLRNFPEIMDFDFDKIFQVFEHLDPESVLSVQPMLKIRTLYSMAPCLRSDSIDAAAKLCPKAEVLSVMNAWIGNETLYKFMQFERLRSITIMNNDGMTLDFDEGILPFLQICGPNLENLILNKFATVDLISLNDSCPRLRKMALCNIGEYTLTYNQVQAAVPAFTCLTALELWFDDRTEFTSTNTILLLLRSALQITNLLVKKSDGFNLDTLRQIWATNSMPCIRRLTLDDCRSLTFEVLDQFLRMENDLSVVRVWSCPHVTREHHKELQQHISENNIDVYLEWFQ